MASNPDNNNLGSTPIAGALTFPVRNEESAQPIAEQPRQPRTLQGLLRFAMEATKAEDAPGNSNFTPMDEERRKFLEEALKSLTVNVVEVLQKAIKVLTDQELIASIKPNDPLPDDVKNSFSNLMEYIDDLDVANDFYKMGGFAIFPVCYSSENDEVRWHASWVLAELCQNNPYCQARALECGLLNVLLNLAHTEQGTALAKCIYAISCACRSFPAGCRELVAQGGCGALGAALGAGDAAARTKAAFLIRYLCLEHPAAHEKFLEENLIPTIAQQIKSTRDQTTEHMLSLLLTLVDLQDSRTLEQCRDPSLGLRQALEETAKSEELREYSEELLKKIFENCPQVETVNDEVAER